MQKTINISNYEEFLIDFLDGNLDEDTRALVVLFLEQNPIIAEEFDGIANYEVEQCIEPFKDKDSLKVQFDTLVLLNQENYEFYFIAYHEGDLSKDEIIQLDDFLELNPNLLDEFNQFAEVSSINAEDVVFENKDSLKLLQIGEDSFMPQYQFENKCIDYIEDNLNAQESNDLQYAINNSEELEAIYALYSNTKLEADKTIIFENKDSLYQYRTIGLVGIAKYINSAAAAVAFLLVFNFYNSTLERIDSQIESNAKLELSVDYSEGVTNAEAVLNDNAILEQQAIVEEQAQVKPNRPTRSLQQKRDINEVVSIDAKGIDAALYKCKDIEFEAATAMAIESFVMDTSSVLITATDTDNPPDSNKDDVTTLKKMQNKALRIFKREKESVANTEPKEAIKKITELAIKGFNKMTESEIFLSQKDEVQQ